MKKYIIALVGAICLAPAAFAQNSSTWTSASGHTYTGSYYSGSWHNGTWCTASGTTTASGNINTNTMSGIIAQEAFTLEVSRLLTVKKNAYTAALTLTGTAQVNAITAANQAFRTGMKTARDTFNKAKLAIRASITLNKKCYFETRENGKMTKKINKFIKKVDKKLEKNNNHDNRDKDRNDD